MKTLEDLVIRAKSSPNIVARKILGYGECLTYNDEDNEAVIYKFISFVRQGLRRMAEREALECFNSELFSQGYRA